MKKIILLLAVILNITSLFAQEEGTIAINAFGGYTMKEKVPFDYVTLHVKDGFQYGGSVEYYFSPMAALELKYNRLNTEFSSNTIIDGNSLPNLKGSMNFILLGGNYYLVESKNQRTIPFVGAAIGIGIIDGDEISSSTHFSWDMRAGVKIKSGGPVSLKLQAYLQSMVSTYGYDYYWTYWGPAYFANYQRVLQFGLGGVISFDLNNHQSKKEE